MNIFQSAEKFKGQDYGDLKNQQLARGVKFVDDEFTLESMGIDMPGVSLKRPNELSEYPKLFSEESYFGFKGGFVKNINIILAFTSLKYSAQFLSKIFINSKAQEWKSDYPNEHPGIFRVRIWQEGMYIDVVVDDQLPVFDGKLMSTASSASNEFWPSILEKAYAKVLGGYKNLESVRLEEIIMDFTGGVTECISLADLRSSPPMKQVAFYEKLEAVMKDGVVIIFCTQPKNGTPNENNNSIGFASGTTSVGDYPSESFGAAGPMDCQIDSNTGLCARYGYLLTRMCAVPKDVSIFGALKDVFRRAGDCPIQTRLLRLRCPLTLVEGGGGLGEWIGAYASTTKEWEDIGLEARRRLRLAFDSEAEFWIPLEAVLEHMAGAIICRVPDTALVSLTGRTWKLDEFHGAWHGHQAGGSIRFRDTFLNNPQYMFDITRDGDEVILALIRKYARDPLTLAIEPASHPLPIGIGLFQVEKNRPTRIHRLGFANTVHVEAARPYRMALIQRHLPVGRYVVIPFVDQPLSSAAYLLRLYLPKWAPSSHEVLLDLPASSSARDFFLGALKQAVRVHVHSALNLSWPDGKNPPSPYCVVSCEGQEARTVVKTGTGSPVWNEAFLFYRRKPQKAPVVIQIMDKHSLGFDVFLGRHSFTDMETSQSHQQEVLLFGRDTKDERLIRMKGTLFVEFYATKSEDLFDV